MGTGGGDGARARAAPPCRPRAESIDALLAALARLPRPVFVHSAGGERAIALAIVQHALATGESAMQAHRWAADRGLVLESTDLYRFVVAEVMRRQWRELAPLVGEGYQAGRAVTRRERETRTSASG
ncbi:MAG: hypothetical protein AB1726_00725 [Planctomycetota bacterium]